MMAIYRSMDTEQMIRVASSIGFGQLVRRSTTSNYDHNLLSDVEELVGLLEKYDGDKERLMALIKMIGDYFHEHQTTIMFERPAGTRELAILAIYRQQLASLIVEFQRKYDLSIANSSFSSEAVILGDLAEIHR